MPPLIIALTRDHAHLARLLTLFERLLERFHTGVALDYERMNELLVSMHNYTDFIHHPNEELIYQFILTRNNEQRDVYRMLLRQHRELRQIGRRFHQSLTGILQESTWLREDVESNGREWVGATRNHLIYEDDVAFPLSMNLLDLADWDILTIKIKAQNENVNSHTLDPAQFRALYRALAEQAQK